MWQKAVPATNFLQRDPDNGQPATERTEVRVLFDKDRIILGVTCFDSEPDRLLGNQMQRDQPFSADDRFMWSIDPFLDGRSGYFFEINPSGAMGDGLITVRPAAAVRRQMNKSWDGIWIARVRRSSIGWTAEIEIPFKTLNFNPNTATWGANFQRTVKRKNEESLWTGWLRNEGLTRMSNAGRVNGIEDISQGIGLDLKPYALGAAGNAPGRGTPGDDRRLRLRPRRVLQRDAGAEGQLHRQHRLRRNRSRPAAHQPDALSAVLSGEARVLPRRRQLLRVPHRRREPVLQPPHRPERG